MATDLAAADRPNIPTIGKEPKIDPKYDKNERLFIETVPIPLCISIASRNKLGGKARNPAPLERKSRAKVANATATAQFRIRRFTEILTKLLRLRSNL